MKLSDFEYQLPPELIAHTPVEPRDHSRLMIVDRKSGSISHDHFYDLPNYLRPDDLFVFNQSKVIPSRLYGKKLSGGKVEVLLLDLGGKFISKPGLREGQEVIFDRFMARVDKDRLTFSADIRQILFDIGQVPLPPYIRNKEVMSSTKEIRNRYQTVYAKDEGSVAAPTAGFHFTKELLEKIPSKAYVTLHVGLGTFLPVKTDNILDHRMHTERFSVPSDLKFQIANHERVVAVGTTTARVLESDWGKNETDIFIYPGYEFRHVNALITNFHLPKSTLLMLVSALAGRELIMKAYREAIREKYRFYSFGDAMFII